ncbi:MAG TPA: hypothetical protein VJC16_01275 [Candidatus Nanoarchaeia archaeon]|nr:hypothetical protein [Candidatus Nanoarchaeia archaeon]
MADDYDLIPHREIRELRERIEGMKSGKGGTEMTDAVERLSISLERLNEVFSAAAHEMQQEERGEHAVMKQLRPLMDKLDTVIEQNQKIARAIISVTEQMQKPGMPRQMQAPRPAPSFPPPFTAPSSPPFSFEQRPMPPSPTFHEGPAPEPEKRRGLFPRFGK